MYSDAVLFSVGVGLLTLIVYALVWKFDLTWEKEDEDPVPQERNRVR